MQSEQIEPLGIIKNLNYNIMETIRSNAEQILRENYRGVENKELMSFKEWVENESIADPYFWFWLFPDADNLDEGMTKKQKREWKEFFDEL